MPGNVTKEGGHDTNLTVSLELLSKIGAGNAIRFGLTLDNNEYEENIDACHVYLYSPTENSQGVILPL